MDTERRPPPQQPRWLARLIGGLSRWQRPVPPPLVLEPPVAARELLAWSRDDGRWKRRQQLRDWDSLLDDVDAAWTRLGPQLRAAVDVEGSLNALRDARCSGLPSVKHRAAVEDAAVELSRAFDAPDALVAAADDVFEAAMRSHRPGSLDDQTKWRLALLAGVGERQGHDWAVTADRMRRGLEWNRGTPAQAIEAAHRALGAPPGRGRSIVWLSVDHAWASGPSTNPAVQLINGDWLLDVLRHWDGPRDGVPPEIAADPQRLLDTCPRFDDSADTREQLPVTFARIDLGEGPTAGVRERARDLLELLIARASVRQGGTNWKISGVCLHFVDDELIFESTGPIGDPYIYDRLRRGDIVGDPTGSTINEEAGRLGDHVPVIDGRMHAALELAQWLNRSRITPAPARLVLAGRIIEQAANWADVQVAELVDEHLAPAWAITRVANDLSRAGAAAVLRLPGGDGITSTDAQRQTFLEERRALLDDAREDGRPRAQPWDVLRRIDWLIDQHAPDTETGDYLRELRERLADGPATAAWLDELIGEVATCNARALRTRNAIVHGGPLIVEVARTTVALRDALAGQALDWVIDALIAGAAVPTAFAAHRARFVAARERLRSGADPLVELAGVAT